MCRVSIIVPVYKTEKYIHRCIDSILAQTFTDFELILVDDGSPDNCGAICDEYAAKDSRIKVIHKENGGASSARNAGIDAARGEHLMFCDSDDVASPVWTERLMRYADMKTLPMGAYCRKAEQLGQKKELSIMEEILAERSLYYVYGQAGIAGFVCNGLFAARIVKENHLRFRERRAQGDYNEDLLFALQYVSHIENIVYTGYSDYLYDTHDDSLSRSYSQYYFEKYQEKFWLWYDFLAKYEEGQGSFGKLADTYIYHFLTALRQEFSAGNRGKFRSIVNSDAVAKCLELSDCKNENARVILLLKHRATTLLWILFTISSLKGRK